MTRKPTFWFDQDGVLAIYEREAYTGENPLWLRPGTHYFAGLMPDDRAISLARSLQIKGNTVYVITNITKEDPICEEHKADKTHWVYEYMPFLKPYLQFITIQKPKYLTAQEILQRPLTHMDVLISDFNNDLVPWAQAGGTAVKYLNGLNSPQSWNGMSLPENACTGEMERLIFSLLRNPKTKKPAHRNL